MSTPNIPRPPGGSGSGGAGVATPLQQMIDRANGRSDNRNTSNKNILVSTLLPKYSPSIASFFNLDTNTPYHIGQFTEFSEQSIVGEAPSIYLIPVINNIDEDDWSEDGVIRYKMAMLDVEDGVLLPLDNTVRLRNKQRYVVAYTDVVEDYLADIKQVISRGHIHDVGAEGVSQSAIGNAMFALIAANIITYDNYRELYTYATRTAHVDDNTTLFPMYVLKLHIPPEAMNNIHRGLYALSVGVRMSAEHMSDDPYDDHPGRKYNQISINHVYSLLGVGAGGYGFINPKRYLIPTSMRVYLTSHRLPFVELTFHNGIKRYYWIVKATVENRTRNHLEFVPMLDYVLTKKHANVIKTLTPEAESESTYAILTFDEITLTDEVLNYDNGLGITDRVLPFKLDLSESGYEITLKDSGASSSTSPFNSKYGRVSEQDVIRLLTGGGEKLESSRYYVRIDNYYDKHPHRTALGRQKSSNRTYFSVFDTRYTPGMIDGFLMNKLSSGYLVTLDPNYNYTVCNNVRIDVYGFYGSYADMRASFAVADNYPMQISEYSYLNYRPRSVVASQGDQVTYNTAQYHDNKRHAQLLHRGVYQHRRTYLYGYSGLMPITHIYTGGNELLNEHMDAILNEMGRRTMLSETNPSNMRDTRYTVYGEPVASQASLRYDLVYHTEEHDSEYTTRRTTKTNHKSYLGLLMASSQVDSNVGKMRNVKGKVHSVLKHSSLKMFTKDNHYIGIPSNESTNGIQGDHYLKSSSLTGRYIGMDKDISLSHVDVKIQVGTPGELLNSDHVKNYDDIMGVESNGGTNYHMFNEHYKAEQRRLMLNFRPTAKDHARILNPVYIVPYGKMDFNESFTDGGFGMRTYHGYHHLMELPPRDDMHRGRKFHNNLYTGVHLMRATEIADGIMSGRHLTDQAFEDMVAGFMGDVHTQQIGTWPYGIIDLGDRLSLPGYICNFIDKVSTIGRWNNKLNNLANLNEVVVQDGHGNTVQKNEAVTVFICSNKSTPHRYTYIISEKNNKFSCNERYPNNYKLDSNGVLHFYIPMFYFISSHRTYVIDLDDRFIFLFDLNNVFISQTLRSLPGLTKIVFHLSLATCYGVNNTIIFNRHDKGIPNTDGVVLDPSVLRRHPSIVISITGNNDLSRFGVPYEINVSELSSIQNPMRESYRKNLLILTASELFEVTGNNDTHYRQPTMARAAAARVSGVLYIDEESWCVDDVHRS